MYICHILQNNLTPEQEADYTKFNLADFEHLLNRSDVTIESEEDLNVRPGYKQINLKLTCSPDNKKVITLFNNANERSSDFMKNGFVDYIKKPHLLIKS